MTQRDGPASRRRKASRSPPESTGSGATPTAPPPRDNYRWLTDLSGGAGIAAQGRAVEDLRDLLLRGTLAYLVRRRSDVSHLDPAEIEALAEDGVQDALESILAKLDQFQGRSKFTTWAYRIVINGMASRLRRHSWGEISLDAMEPYQVEALTGELGEGLGPERTAEDRDAWSLVAELLSSELTDRQRQVVVDVVIRGESPASVARQLSITRNNCYKVLHDARVRLRRALGDRGLTVEELVA